MRASRVLLAWLVCTLPVLAAAQPARMATAGHGDVTIAYADRGTGPAIVLLPSLGRGAADFDDLAARLAAAGFRVLCPEPRGIRGSIGTLAGATLHDFSADIAAVVEQANAAPVVVLGHAYGNTVARTLATERPDLVSGVILVAASGRAFLSETVKQAITRASDLSLPDDQRLLYLRTGYFAPGNEASVWLEGWHPELQAAEFKAAAAVPPREYVRAGGRMPILEIQGGDDAIIPREQSRALIDELGGRVTLVVIPHAGHAMLPEQPAALAGAIIAWMRR